MSNRKRRGRGEGSIYERDDGLWVSSISLGYKADGTRNRKTVYGKSKQEVQEKLRELHTGAGSVASPASLSLADYLDQWLKIKEGRVEQRTHEQYESHVRLHIKPLIGGTRLAKHSALHVETLLRQMGEGGDSAAMRGKVLTTSRTALKHAVHPLKYLAANPAAGIEKPRHQAPDVRALDLDQTAAFLEAAREDRFHAFYVTALDSGARPGELLALTWADVDLDGAAITINKTLMEGKGALKVETTKTRKSRRRISLSRYSAEAIAEHRKRMLAEGNFGADKPVFCSSTGTHMRRGNLWKNHFGKVRRRAGLPEFRLYDLRHSMATLLLLMNENPKVVSERLGHTTTKLTLDTYSHMLPGMQERAAAKLDAIRRQRPEDKQAAG